MKKGGTRGFLYMVIAVIGVVLFMSMFSSIMTAVVALLAVTGLSTFIAMSTILGIAPTVLLLAGTVGGGLLYRKGYNMAAGSDPNGLMRMVMGVLEIILFITLFSTIISSAYTLYGSYGSNTTFIAFGTVLTIVPTVLFIGGLFAGIGTAVGGYRARKRRRAL